MRLLLLLPILLLFACNEPGTTNVVEKPADLIPEDKMVQVLTDVHLLEASLGVRAGQAQAIRNRLPGMPIDSLVPMDVQTKKEPLPYFDIFKKHGVTHKQYEASVKWYASQPDMLSRIYDEVIIELTRRQAHDNLANPVQPAAPNPAQDSTPHSRAIIPTGKIVR